MKQKSITLFRDADGRVVDFERWSCGPRGAEEKTRWLLSQELYKACLRLQGAVIAEICRTPDASGDYIPVKSFGIQEV